MSADADAVQSTDAVGGLDAVGSCEDCVASWDPRDAFGVVSIRRASVSPAWGAELLMTTPCPERVEVVHTRGDLGRLLFESLA